MKSRSLIWFSFGPILGSILSFITVPMTSWLFEPDDLGRLAILNTVAGLFVMIISLGLDQAYVREYYSYCNKAELFKVVTRIPMFLCVILLFVLTPFLAILSSLIFDFSSNLIGLVIIGLCFSSLINRFLSLCFRMEENGIAYSLSILFPKIIFLTALLLFYLCELNFGFQYLVVSSFVGSIVVTVYLMHSSPSHWRGWVSQKVRKDDFYGVLKYGFPLLFSGVAFWALTAMDKIFLRAFSTFEQLGIYSVAVSFAGAAMVLHMVFSTVWAPTIYKWIEHRINLEKIELVVKLLLVIVFFIFNTVGALLFLIEYILPEKYMAVQSMILLCMAYPLFYVISEATGVGIGITKRSLLSMISTILSLVVNLVLNCIFVERFGAAGASIATAVSFSVLLVLKTEFSVYLGYSYHRWKSYIVSFWMLFLSVLYFVFPSQLYLNYVFAISSIIALLYGIYLLKNTIGHFNSTSQSGLN